MRGSAERTMSMEKDQLAGKLIPLQVGKYLVGLSGGADSVALLYLLNEQREKWQLELEAVHVNHGLRGKASDEDEAWCTELCRKLSIPLRISRIKLNGHRDENTARNARMMCFSNGFRRLGPKG